MINGTVQITGPFAPTSSGDTYPTHFSNYGKGGLMTFDSLSGRNDLTESRREVGMIVGVTIDSATTYYTLNEKPWDYTDNDWGILQTVDTVTGITYKEEYDLLPDGGQFEILSFDPEKNTIYVSGDCTSYVVTDNQSIYWINCTERQNDGWYATNKSINYDGTGTTMPLLSYVGIYDNKTINGHIIIPDYIVTTEYDGKGGIIVNGDVTGDFSKGDLIRLDGSTSGTYLSGLKGLGFISDPPNFDGTNTTIKITFS